MGSMVICPNCGAEIEKDSTKCPYCGYINIEGAEKKFQADLEDIRNDIEDTKKEPSRALARGFKGGTKTILITVAILVSIAVLIAIELYRETRDEPKMFLTAEEQAYASAYIETAGEQLTEAFDDMDIPRMAEIFDKAYSEDRVSIWGVDHYEAGYASSCYMKLKQCLPNLEKAELSRMEAEEITYYCFYFYYRAYGEDGAHIFDLIRDNEIMPIITGRLGYTEEDMENFRDRVFDGTYVNRSRVYRVTKKYFENYM